MTIDATQGKAGKLVTFFRHSLQLLSGSLFFVFPLRKRNFHEAFPDNCGIHLV
jgi:hypothetical protein